MEPFSELIGSHPRVEELKKLAQRVARTNSTILITGESGTGKELVAREIHRCSPRSAFPFFIVNCSALPDTLLESELFGHARGAFTGADASTPGLFEAANGGSLFLDEVVDMSPSSQAKLLGVLENQEIRRVGDTAYRKVDVRIMAACNRSLEGEVKHRKFREDLLFRLNTVKISLPPLRERAEDIPHLVQHFVEKYASLREEKVTTIDPVAMAALLEYPWPGNVRELKHVVERAMILGDGPELGLKDLSSEVLAFQLAGKGGRSDNYAFSLSRLEVIQRDHVLRVLKEVGGNKRRAASILGIDRSTLYRMLERYAQVG